MKRIKKCKKMIGMIAILLATLMIPNAVTAKGGQVSKTGKLGTTRNFTGTASIAASNASAVTGSDSSVIVRVEATYVEMNTKTGKTRSIQRNSEKNGIASVAISAESGYQSKSIQSRHFGNYNGIVNYFDLSKNY